VTEGQFGEPFAPAIEECIGIDHYHACPQLERSRKGHVQLGLAAGVQDIQLETEGTRALLDRLRLDQPL
jgi:hypothetical protein